MWQRRRPTALGRLEDIRLSLRAVAVMALGGHGQPCRSWSDAVLDARGKSEGWTEEMRKKASDAAAAFGEGLSRVRKGVEIAALLFRRHGHRSHELKADQGEAGPCNLGIGSASKFIVVAC